VFSPEFNLTQRRSGKGRRRGKSRWWFEQKKKIEWKAKRGCRVIPCDGGRGGAKVVGGDERRVGKWTKMETLPRGLGRGTGKRNSCDQLARNSQTPVLSANGTAALKKGGIDAKSKLRKGAPTRLKLGEKGGL